MSFVQIKICGLSTPETVDAAVAAGASHVGFVHYAPSPRHVTLAQAAALRERLPDRVKAVVLLVNADAALVEQAMAAVRPDVIQFHGKESPQDIAAIRSLHGVECWKAIGVKDAGDLAKALAFKDAVDLVLYDAEAGKLPGGNGLALDWSLLTGYCHQMPWGLAGGLNPANVADAVRQTGALLVDTSSGVEIKPGLKDMDRIKAFCQSAQL